MIQTYRMIEMVFIYKSIYSQYLLVQIQNEKNMALNEHDFLFNFMRNLGLDII